MEILGVEAHVTSSLQQGSWWQPHAKAVTGACHAQHLPDAPNTPARDSQAGGLGAGAGAGAGSRDKVFSPRLSKVPVTRTLAEPAAYPECV